MTEPLRLTLPSTDGAAGETYLWSDGELPPGAGPRLLMTGDFCPGTDLPDDAAWLRPGPGAEEPLLLSLTRSADFTVTNLECPLGRGEAPRKSGPRLCAAPDWARVLGASGIDAVCLANNHAMDQGEEGLLSTLSALAGAGVLHVGAGRDLETARRPLVAPLRDRRVAILACAEHEFGVARPDAAGVAPLTPEAALKAIRAAHEAADAVVVIVHGGNEAYPLPRPGLRETCRFLVDCGADAVVCSHSHTIGPIEWYAGAPIVYGLGNLYFPWRAKAQPRAWHDSLCVLLEFGERIRLHVVPARFDEERQGIRSLPEEDHLRLARHVESLSAQVVNDVALAEGWNGFVLAHRRDYLGMLLGLSRAERLALRVGVWPWWRMPRDRLPELLNVVRCESHREALLHLLEDESAKGPRGRRSK